MSTPPLTSSFRSSVSWRQTISIFVLFMLICGGLIAWGNYHATYHYAVVQDGVLYRDGSRSIRELNNAVGKAKPKTVISLIDDQELHDPAKPQFREEEADMSARGIAYQRIAVKLGGWPTSEDIQQFLKTMEDASRQPVLIHCAQGVRRTAMFVAAYQETVLGYDRQRAKDAILSFGHSEKTIDEIKKFIDNYDPKTRTISSELYKISGGPYDNVEQDQHSP